MSNHSGEIAEALPEKDLIKIIECPVCNTVPFPPIYGCFNGHIICNTCRPKLQHCAVCRQSFWEGRNRVIESIVESSKFHCNYREEGCNEIVPGNEIKNHIKDCRFAPHNIRANYTEDPAAPISWVPCSNGFLPENAIEGGVDETGQKIYVARAAISGGMIPGKFKVSTGKAYIPWNCREHEKSEYEILVAPPDMVTWTHGYFGYVPPLAIPGGPAETGELLYIGRWALSNQKVIGKVHPSHRCCYIGFEGQELSRQHYEVLTRTVNIDFETPSPPLHPIDFDSMDNFD